MFGYASNDTLLRRMATASVLSSPESSPFRLRVFISLPQSRRKSREKSRPPYVGRVSFICKSHDFHMQVTRPSYEGRDFSQGLR